MRSAVRRWATPITLLVLLALLGYGLWWGWEQLTRPFSDSTPCVTQSASVLITTQVTVQVFNGGSASGLAGQVTEQLAYHGFHTKSAANTSEQVGATTIVGAATDSPEVQLVAGFFVDPQTRGDEPIAAQGLLGLEFDDDGLLVDQFGAALRREEGERRLAGQDPGRALQAVAPHRSARWRMAGSGRPRGRGRRPHHLRRAPALDPHRWPLPRSGLRRGTGRRLSQPLVGAANCR